MSARVILSESPAVGGVGEGMSASGDNNIVGRGLPAALPYCVVDAGGGQNHLAYYNYSFSMDEPAATGAQVVTAAGVSVHMTEAALAAKRVEPDTPALPPMSDVQAIVAEEEVEIAANVSCTPVDAAVKAPNMAYCAVDAVGVADYIYSFTEADPAGVGSKTFDSMGVSVYVREAALDRKRSEKDPEPLVAAPVSEPTVGAVREETIATPAEPISRERAARAAMRASVMRHCVVSPTGVDGQLSPVYYAFSENKPAGVNAADAEVDGISLHYMVQAFKNLSAVTAVLPTVNEVEPAPVQEEKEEVVVVQEESAVEAEVDRAEYIAQLSRALRTVDAANIRFANIAEAEPSPVQEEDRTEFVAQLSRALRTVDAAKIQFATITEVEPAPAEAGSPLTYSATPIRSKPGDTMSALKGNGKSGLAVFERGSGIAAWQGLEIGYEMDIELEVPVAPATSIAMDTTSQPAEYRGTGPARSGAAVFGNGVGVASWQPAQLDAPVASSPHMVQPATPSEEMAAAMAKVMTTAMGDVQPATEKAAVAEPVVAAVPTSQPAVAAGADVKEESVMSRSKKPDFDMMVQYLIWALAGAFLVYRFIISPA